MPYFNGGYNIHTNVIDLGAAVTVSEIDGLETVTTADGQLSLSGSNVVDIGNIVSVSLNTQRLTSLVANIASATIDALSATTLNATTLTATAANLTNATIDALTSTTATIRDLFATNFETVTLTLKELYADLVQVDGTLTVNQNATFFADTFMNRDATVARDLLVGGSFTAGNVITFEAFIKPNSAGEYVWRHAPLKPPVVHLGAIEARGGGRPLIACLEYSEKDYATFRFYQLSIIGPEAIGDTNKVCFLAIGG
jgi:hypothetical protein